MLSCSIWFSAPSFWMSGRLESRCVGRVYGADGDVRAASNMLVSVFIGVWSFSCIFYGTVCMNMYTMSRNLRSLLRLQLFNSHFLDSLIRVLFTTVNE